MRQLVHHKVIILGFSQALSAIDTRCCSPLIIVMGNYSTGAQAQLVSKLLQDLTHLAKLLLPIQHFSFAVKLGTRL